MPKRPPPRGTFRIIGGEWRRRRLEFPTDLDIRPSPDRVRETLFNWLMPFIEGARCLDLFAGSGALGLEALSRGAGEVVFVDREPKVGTAIRAHLSKLGGTERAQVVSAEGMQYLSTARQAFDVVFLDPPYHRGMLPALLAELPSHLSENHCVYLEHERKSGFQLPADWEMLKSAQAGQVACSLVRLLPSKHNSGVQTVDHR